MQQRPFRLHTENHRNEGKWIHNKRETTCWANHIIQYIVQSGQNLDHSKDTTFRSVHIHHQHQPQQQQHCINAKSHIWNSPKEFTHTSGQMHFISKGNGILVDLFFLSESRSTRLIRRQSERTVYNPSPSSSPYIYASLVLNGSEWIINIGRCRCPGRTRNQWDAHMCVN